MVVDNSMNIMRSSRRIPLKYRIVLAVLLVINTIQLVFAARPLSLTKTRLAFYPRGGGATTSITLQQSSNYHTISRRRKYINTVSKSTASSNSIQNVGLFKRNKKVVDFDEDYDLDHYNPPHNEQGNEPSLEELRTQLGPIGLLVSSGIELSVITLQSYISGGILGYIGGSVMNIPSTIFGKEMGSVASRFGILHTKAVTSFKSWATLSAAFSGFNNFVRLSRGGREEDGWNAILGSGLAGAFLNRSGGPQAMIQGGATYAGFTYVMEKFFSSPSTKQRTHKELAYTDVPLNEDW